MLLSLCTLLFGLLPNSLGQSVCEVNELDTKLTGYLVFPSNRREYAKEKQVCFEKTSGSNPSVIALPKTYQDVVILMEFCNKHDLRPRIKSGGHSFTGWSQKDNEWVISTKYLADIRVSNDDHTIHLGAGVRFESIYQQLKGTGYLFPGGTCPTVGVSGFLLGGGHSPFVRSIGVSSDSILSMKVVTPDATLITVSPSEHSDLFYALRGAGHGNFGLVVEFHVQMYRSQVYHGEYEWHFPREKTMRRMLIHMNEWMSTAPDSIGFQVHLYPHVAKLLFFYFGNSSEGRALLQTFEKRLPKPCKIRRSTGSQYDYIAYTSKFLGKYPIPARNYMKTGMYESLTPKAIEFLVSKWKKYSKLIKIPKGLLAVVITTLGGAAVQEPDVSSAVTYRQAQYVVELAGNWWLKRHDTFWHRRLQRLKQDLDQHASFVGTYVNYVDAALTDWAQAYFANDIDRLQRIKDRYDPSGRLEYEAGVYTTGKVRKYAL